MSVSPKCHLIAVAGGKGGVGKSVFAANLALAITNEIRASVLLIDLDEKSCGDQSIILGLKPVKTVLDLTRFQGVVNQQNMRQFLAFHKTGLGYLGAVNGPEQSLSGDSRAFSKQLFGLSQNFNYIVVDVGNTAGDLQLAAMEIASAIMIVLSPEVLVVNQTKRLLNELSAATLPSQLFQVVINQAQQRGGLSPQLVANNLRLPVTGIIPKEEAVFSQALQSSIPFILSHGGSQSAQVYFDIVRKLTGGILQKNKTLSRPKKQTEESKGLNAVNNVGSSIGPGGKKKKFNPITLLKMQVHTELIKEMDLKKDLTQAKDEASKKELKDKTRLAVSKLVDKRGVGLSRTERSQVIKQVLDEALDLGPLEELLADPNVTEIMVNGCDQIFCEKNGKLQLSSITFTSNQQLRNIIERIVMPLGRRIDEKNTLCGCSFGRWF